MAITQVQQKHAYPNTAATFTSSVTEGNLIIVACSWNGPTVAQTATCSDNLSPTTSYTSVGPIRASSNFTQLQLFWGFAQASASCTVTVTSETDMGLTIYEYAGISQYGLVTNNGTQSGKASPATVSLTNLAGGMMFGCYANESTPIVEPAPVQGSIAQYDSGHADWQMEYLNIPTAGAVNFGYTTSTTYFNQAFIGISFSNNNGFFHMFK